MQDSIYVSCPERQIHGDRKEMPGFQGLGRPGEGGRRREYIMGWGFRSGRAMSKFWNPIVATVAATL